MPYKSRRELPPAVRELPNHGQDIYRRAFNAALTQYDGDESRAHATAWAAVKRRYRKADDGSWVTLKENQPVIIVQGDFHMAGQGQATWPESDDPDDEPTPEPEETPEPDPLIITATEAYHALAAVAPLFPDEAQRDTCTQALAQIERILPTPFTQESLTESADPAQAKESLEALQVAQYRLDEQGQRHAAWEYKLIDDVIDMLKQLRGLTPAEQRAMATAHQDSAEAQMKDGFHSGTMRESMAFLREAGDGNGSQWEVCIIQAGMSKNGRTYPLPVLEAAAPLFDGARVYTYDRLLKGKEVFDHLSEEEVKANPQGYAKDLVGFLKDPKVIGSRLTATFVIFEGAGWLRKNLQDAFRHGQREIYGLSIDAEGDGHLVEQDGRHIVHVDVIRRVRSVDVVTFPAAGGGFMRLVASGLAYMADPDMDASDAHMEQVMRGLNRQIARLELQLNLTDVLDMDGIPDETRRTLRGQILRAVDAYADRLTWG